MQSTPTPGELLDDTPERVERARERTETLELLVRFATLLGLIAAALIAAAILVRLSGADLTRL